jgi:hypothetical protein
MNLEIKQRLDKGKIFSCLGARVYAVVFNSR